MECLLCGHSTKDPCVTNLKEPTKHNPKSCVLLAQNPLTPKGEPTHRIVFEGEIAYIPIEDPIIRRYLLTAYTPVVEDGSRALFEGGICMFCDQRVTDPCGNQEVAADCQNLKAVPLF